MPFDWNEYLQFAKALASTTDEASRRSAISRAYYCVFHVAKNYATEHLGYQFRPEMPAHKQLWDCFDGKGSTFKAVFIKGMSLKRLRQDADYDADATIPEVAQAVQAAENALTYLEQISGQNSN